MPIDLSDIPDAETVYLSDIPDVDQVEAGTGATTLPTPDLGQDLINSELFGVDPGTAASGRDTIEQVLKERSEKLNVEKERTKSIQTGIQNGNFGALIPYLGLSAFEGLAGILLRPVDAIAGTESDKLVRDAIEYWKEKSPDIKFRDVGVGRDETEKVPTEFGGALKSWLTNFELQSKQGSVKQIAGDTASLTGLVAGPLRVASTASIAVVAKTAQSARPLFQSIYRGMATGALLGEGDTEQTLHNMALFGVFDGMTGFLGKVSSIPRVISESPIYRQMTVKERGLVIQSLDEAVQGAERQLELLRQRGASSEALEAFAGKTEGEILRSFDNPTWRKHALERRIKKEEPIEIEKTKELPKEQLPVSEQKAGMPKSPEQAAKDLGVELRGEGVKPKEPWEMTQKEFFHPQFNRIAIDRFEAAEPGQIVGTVGDFIKGEKTREALKDVLDIKVMRLDKPVQAGKEVEPKEGIEFKGASGRFRGEPTIFIKKTGDFIKTLLEEAAHQMRVSRGRPMTKQDITTIDPEAQKGLPEEVSAKRFSEFLAGLANKELTHSETIRKAIEEGRPVPPEVLKDYPDLLAKQQGVEYKGETDGVFMFQDPETGSVSVENLSDLPEMIASKRAKFAQTVKTVPEERVGYSPVPQQPIPISEIDTFNKLSQEASRKALDNISAQDLKEERKILADVRKQAEDIVRENPVVGALDEAFKAGGLNLESVMAAGISRPEIAEIQKKRPGLIRENGKAEADIFVNEVGFDTVDEFFQAVKQFPGVAKQKEDLIQELFDEAMIGIDEGRALILRERIVDEEINVLTSMLGRKPKARKDLKGIIRRESGQEKVKDIQNVDTRKALIDQLKFEAKAAREAFSAGKLEAALKHKEKQRELTARARERKRQSEIVKRIINDFKKVQKKLNPKTRKPGAGLPEAQAKPIRDLLNDLDLSKPTKKTLKRLEGTRQYLEDNPMAALPEGVLKSLGRLEKTPVRDLGLSDLESIHQAVMHHAKLAETKNKIIVRRKAKAFKETLTGAINELNLPEDISNRMDSIVDGTVQKGRSIGRRIVDNFGIRQEGYDLIVESIAGPESVAYDVLYRQVKEGTRKQLEISQDYYDDLNKNLKDAGFEPIAVTKTKILKNPKEVKDINKWGAEEVVVGRFKLTRAQRVSLAMHDRNPDNRDAVLNGGLGLRFSDEPNRVHKVSEAELQEIIDSLDKNELALADSAGKLFDKMGENLDAEFQKIYGYAMPRVDNYYPKSVMPLERGAQLDSGTEEFLKKFGGRWSKPTLEKGFLEVRKDSKAPIYLDPIFDVVNKSITRAAAFEALEGPLNNASKLLYNPNFRKAIEAKYKDDLVWREIDKGLKDIAGLHEGMSDLDKTFMSLRAKLTTTVLGLNPFVIAIQPLSYPMYLRYVPAEYLYKGQLEFWKDPNAMVKKLREHSPEFRERISGGFNQDLAELSTRTANLSLGAQPKMVEKFMGGIKGGDIMAVGPGMQGAINFVLDSFEKGIVNDDMRVALDITKDDLTRLTPEDKVALAYRYAEFATNLTQPTFAPIHRSPIQRGGAIEKTVSMFSSFTLRTKDQMFRAAREYKRAKTPEQKSRAANRFAAIFVLAAVNSIGILGRDKIRDYLYGRKAERSIPLEITKNFAGYWLILRDIAGSAESIAQRGKMGYDVSYPTEKIMQLPANIAGNAIRAASNEDKKKRRKAALELIDDTMEILFLSKGLPYQNVKNLGKIATASARRKKKGVGAPKK